MLECCYQRALLGGPKEGGKKATNMNKTSEIPQGLKEFYERLCEAFSLYTHINPEVAKNQRMVNAAFVCQAQGDIHKLQKLEDFAGMNTHQLLEVATKVFVSQNQETQ